MSEQRSENQPHQPLLPYFHEALIADIPEKTFKAVGSLATTHGIPETDIIAALDSDDRVRRPWQQKNLELFTQSSKKLTFREFWSAFHASVASRAPSK